MLKALAAALAVVVTIGAVQAQETPVVTGPNFQQMPTSQLQVRVGGTLESLGAALSAAQGCTLNCNFGGTTTTAGIVNTGTISSTGAIVTGAAAGGAGNSKFLSRSATSDNTTQALILQNSSTTILDEVYGNGQRTSNLNSQVWTVSNGQINVNGGQVTAAQFAASSGLATPTGVLGAGAGTGAAFGAGSPAGYFNGHTIEIVTGTSPSASAVIASITVGPSGCPHAVVPVLTAANAATAAAMNATPIYAVGVTGNGYTINSTTALSASADLIFDVSLGCY